MASVEGKKKRRLRGDDEDESDNWRFFERRRKTDEENAVGSTSGAHGSAADCGSVNYINIKDNYPVYETARASSHSKCSEACRFEDSAASVTQYSKVVHSPLVIPLLFGYDRQTKSVKDSTSKGKATNDTIVYVTPCGRSLTNLRALDTYLIAVGSFIPIGCFSFQPDLDIARNFVVPRGKVQASRVITNAFAPNEISAFNCHDDSLPGKFIYVTNSIKSTATSERIEREQRKQRVDGCSCKGYCEPAIDEGGVSNCGCMGRLSAQSSGYGYGLLNRSQRFILECTDACGCLPLCRNRVSVNAIPWRVMIYYYPNKRWGVRSTCDIPRGSFIGLYQGQILTETELDREERTDTFFLTLKSLDIAGTSVSDDSENASMSGPYGKLFSIDASRFGNFTRFLNHSCTPNLYAQPIFREHCDPLLYDMGFFAKRNIPAGEELTWDWKRSMVREKERPVECFCGSENCRKDRRQ
ncbi:putative Histone-lysine N-methyltransferase, H3 lysine-9 specific SUVH1 [Hypsibius exemplaris]|uniref:Histone-lysine N-methyltransferase, H3 lysine-9 specific SUVH1 n=1 Tax=Hypsibius exemplaris TaxID=2072580 RepID=A0A1W0WHT3_HYPEX|nr:putative Histone-lysine N-methyltransferase, H3 lysine-9 specific SUVH1 [Hypsibius exemplaris]